jgi:protein-S-isoprenylcysteine O-methyltransferase Ste14
MLSMQSRRAQRKKRLFHYGLTIVQAAGIAYSLYVFYHKSKPAAEDAGRRPRFGIIVKYLELLVVVVSFICWFVARMQLGESFSVRPQAYVLITHGMYSVFSHPIYVFSATGFVGYVLLLKEYKWLLLLIVLVPAQIYRARKEAQVLRSAFGSEYQDYRESTVLF